MLDIARIGDIGLGLCYGNGCDDLKHGGNPVTGTIITGSSTVMANGLGMARIGDTIISNCQHAQVGIIITGSGKCYASGLGISRVGDNFEGCYGGSGDGIIITGSPNVRCT